MLRSSCAAAADELHSDDAPLDVDAAAEREPLETERRLRGRGALSRGMKGEGSTVQCSGMPDSAPGAFPFFRADGASAESVSIVWCIA